MDFAWNIYKRLLITSYKEYSRELLPLLFSLALPLFFIVSMGTIGSASGPAEPFTFKVLVIGSDPASDAVSVALGENPLFKVSRATEGDAQAIIQAGRVQAVLRPSGSSAGQLEISTTESFRHVVSIIERQLASPAPATGEPAVEHRLITEPKYDYFVFVFPSIMALSLLQVSLFGTASPIVAAKEKGIYRYYSVVPMPRLALLASQVSARLVIASAQIGLLLAVGCLLYKVHVENPFQLLTTVLLGSIVLISCGYAIAGVFSSSSVSTFFLLFLNFYCMAFGQLFVDMSDSYWQWLVLTTPVGFVSDSLRQAVTGQAGMFPLYVDIAGMLFYLLLSVLVVVKYFSFQSKVK